MRNNAAARRDYLVRTGQLGQFKPVPRSPYRDTARAQQIVHNLTAMRKRS